MLAIIEFLKNKDTQGNGSLNMIYGVEKFDHAWEMMIDKILGNVIDKSAYNPHCWRSDCNKAPKKYEEE